MITCLILDDEELAIGLLRQYIAKIPQLDLKASFTDPTEALLYLEKQSVDLIFLDIEMPNFAIDGLDFIRIVGNDQHYVFTTGYPQYALSSYDYNTVDFLHKPYTFERFAKAIQKAKQVLTASRTDSQETDTFTYIRVDGKLQRIDFAELCWISSERNGIWLYTETGQFNTPLQISDMETRLPEQQFVRIHKSFIISLNKADVINKDYACVQRQGALHEIPIGDTYRKEFVSLLERKIKKKG